MWKRDSDGEGEWRRGGEEDGGREQAGPRTFPSSSPVSPCVVWKRLLALSPWAGYGGQWKFSDLLSLPLSLFMVHGPLGSLVWVAQFLFAAAKLVWPCLGK